MNTTEAPIPPSILQNLTGAAKEGADLVGVSMDDESSVIVDAVDRFLSKPKKSRGLHKIDNWEDRALPIGSLWGSALVREFGWHWASLTQHDPHFKAIAVVSKSGSLAILPFHYCFCCLEENAVSRVLLAFNMLTEGKIPKVKARTYANLMHRVDYIVPP